jgi:uncharacterized repeat protein (TIGR01451 family)
MVRSMTKRGMPKPFAILIAVLMALYFVPLNALPASAAANPGGFEIDGNLVVDNGGIDWNSLSPGDAGFATDVDNTSASGQDASTFKGASKEYNLQNEAGGWPGWTFGSGNATGKSDFGRWATYSTLDANGHIWLDLGFDRGFGTGTAKYAFELNQIKQSDVNNPNPDRSQGDLKLIVWDQGNGVITLTGDAQNTDVGLYKWVDPDQAAGGVAEDTNQNGGWVKVENPGTFVGASNTGTTPVSVPSWWTSGNLTGGKLAKDTFLEFAIDLSSFGAAPGCPSKGFAAANARSITGTGGPGTLVDYLPALGVHIPSTCTSLVTQASDKVVIGNSISDTATMTPSAATGTVTFKVYGPDDATCANAPVATLGPITVSNGTAASGPYTPTQVGTYRWIASFTSSDPNHFADTAGACNDPNEQSVVEKKQPSISTQASAGGAVPSALTDVATVSGLTPNAGGSVTFNAYGPNDSTCTGAVAFTSTNNLGAVNAGSATATSGTFTPSAVGTYRWIASYSGDASNKAVAGACNDTNESALIDKRQPSITTDASNGGALPSVDLSDVATVTNLTADAGGSVTFNLYGPDDASCTGAVIFTSTNAIGAVAGGVASATSGTYTATAAGTYRWIASYGGDAKNKSVAGQCNDASESVVVDKASPTITTDAQDTAKLPDATVNDTATLSGLNPGAGGTVVFRLYGPSSTPVCNDNGAAKNLVFTSSAVTVNGNGSYGPVSTQVTKAGTYYWIASYSGDANNNSVSGTCGEATEVSSVDKASPAITTTATASTTLPNGTVKDTANVTGLTSDATGNVVFHLYGPSAQPDCSGVPVFTSTKPIGTVTGGAASVDSATFTPAKAGSYYWTASYEGDGNNNPAIAACGADNETSVVNPSTTSISTAATDGQLPAGTIHDVATISGLTANATGTVSFALYGPSAQPDCNSNAIFTVLENLGTVTAGSASVNSGNFTPTTAGNYWWVASYSGDLNNTSAFGSCGDQGEKSTVTPATPTLTTTATDTTALPDGTLKDKADLSGLTTDATGTVIFRLYGPDATPGTPTCTDGQGGNLVFTSGPISITNNQDGTASATSGDFTPTNTGTYFWVASYSGDANNGSVAGKCGDSGETSTVTKASPSISTDATSASLPAGTIHDVATVSGLSANATGTVTFNLYGPSASPNCDGAVVFTSTKDLGVVSGGTATVTSAAFTPVTAGKYYWIASYSGDGNNNAKAGQCGAQGETSTVTPAQPLISTRATDAQLPSGTIHDVADVTALTPNATGTVTFKLWGPSASASCAGTPLFTDTEDLGTVSAGGAASVTSASFTPTKSGNYWWIASYHSGDANNTDVAGTCGDTGEKSVVSPATPTIATSATESATLPAGALTDTATLTGLSADPTGTVTFTLYGPDASPETPTCSAGTLVFTSPDVAISSSGSGTATASSPAFTPSVTGTYFWIASYSGDPNNVAVAGACGDAHETSTVEKAGPAITTQVPATSEVLSPTATLTDTATLSGATTNPAATGTITFTLYGPFGSAPGANSCTAGNVVGTRTATVTGNASYSPATGITVNVVGYYTWVADYSGDANNTSATHACGLANETVHVLPTHGTITTDAIDHVKLSDGPTTISDQATLSGVTENPAAGGTIEFKVYGPFPTQPGANSCTEANLVGGGPYTVPVNGPGTYTSPDVQVKLAGFYVWVASYSGDANNGSATHACGQTVETTTVEKASPTITTQVAAASVSLPNASLVDTATLAGATSDPKATGTITFRLYGPFAEAPNSDSCTEGNLVDTEVVTVTNGNGSYPSPAVVVHAAGYYTWVARYSGDDNNESATHPCAQESETVQVTKAAPSVATVATESANIQLGGTISDAATVSGLASAGTYGSVTFALYGPDDATCVTTPVFTSTVALTATDNGDGTASGTAASGSFTPTAAGIYRWIATYAGDDNNQQSAGACNDPNEQSQVFAGNHPTLDKNSVPPSGSAVQPGSTIDYTVTVGNTGDVAIGDTPVTDILPPHVTVKAGTISDGGVLAGGVITWHVALAPGASHTFTYSVTVDNDAPQGGVLVNTARFLDLQDTTTHVVPSGALALVKEVSPVAGHGVVVNFGDKLTYKLTASATGQLDQPDAVVKDYLPGRDPAHPKSGDVTYVAGSAKCIGAGTCTVTGPDANGLITWHLGAMAAGTSRQVTFQVIIKDVTGPAGSTIAEDIINQGTVQSARTPVTPSNVVVTPVSKVLPVKVGPKELPHTGATLPVGPTVGGGILLLGLGILLVATTRRRRGELLG